MLGFKPLNKAHSNIKSHKNSISLKQKFYNFICCIKKPTIDENKSKKSEITTNLLAKHKSISFKIKSGLFSNKESDVDPKTKQLQNFSNIINVNMYQDTDKEL